MLIKGIQGRFLRRLVSIQFHSFQFHSYLGMEIKLFNEDWRKKIWFYIFVHRRSYAWLISLRVWICVASLLLVGILISFQWINFQSILQVVLIFLCLILSLIKCIFLGRLQTTKAAWFMLIFLCLILSLIKCIFLGRLETTKAAWFISS